MKIRNKSCVCKFCSNTFLAADIKAKVCLLCITNQTTCACGNKKTIKSNKCITCNASQRKGKTYIEIYGTKDMKCGYQKGDKNIAKKEDIRIKIKNGVYNSYTEELRKLRGNTLREINIRNGYGFKKKFLNSKGETFRSILEVNFSELLIKNNIPYLYEVPIKLINGNYKIVDFQISNLLVEISGFAYTDWRQDFTKKIDLLRKSVANPILVLTYPSNFHTIYKIADINLFTDTLDNEQHYLDTIRWVTESLLFA